MLCCLIFNSKKDFYAKKRNFGEKPLAFFFGEKVSAFLFLKSSFPGRSFWNVHRIDTTSGKFATNDETRQSQPFDQNSSFGNA